MESNLRSDIFDYHEQRWLQSDDPTPAPSPIIFVTSGTETSTLEAWKAFMILVFFVLFGGHAYLTALMLGKSRIGIGKSALKIYRVIYHFVPFIMAIFATLYAFFQVSIVFQVYLFLTSVIYSPSAIGGDNEDEELRTEIAAAICVFALGFFSVPATNVLVSAFSFAKSLFMLNIHFLARTDHGGLVDIIGEVNVHKLPYELQIVQARLTSSAQESKTGILWLHHFIRMSMLATILSALGPLATITQGGRWRNADVYAVLFAGVCPVACWTIIVILKLFKLFIQCIRCKKTSLVDPTARELEMLEQAEKNRNLDAEQAKKDLERLEALEARTDHVAAVLEIGEAGLDKEFEENFPERGSDVSRAETEQSIAAEELHPYIFKALLFMILSMDLSILLVGCIAGYQSTGITSMGGYLLRYMMYTAAVYYALLAAIPRTLASWTAIDLLWPTLTQWHGPIRKLAGSLTIIGICLSVLSALGFVYLTNFFRSSRSLEGFLVILIILCTILFGASLLISFSRPIIEKFLLDVKHSAVYIWWALHCRGHEYMKMLRRPDNVVGLTEQLSHLRRVSHESGSASRRSKGKPSFQSQRGTAVSEHDGGTSPRLLSLPSGESSRPPSVQASAADTEVVRQSSWSRRILRVFSSRQEQSGREPRHHRAATTGSIPLSSPPMSPTSTQSAKHHQRVGSKDSTQLRDYSSVASNRRPSARSDLRSELSNVDDRVITTHHRKTRLVWPQITEQPYIQGCCCQLFTFIVVLLAVYYGLNSLRDSWGSVNNSTTARTASFSEIQPIKWASTPTAYPICSERWLAAGLDIYDLALFARQAYEPEPSVHSFLQSAYPAWNMTMAFKGSTSFVRFYVLHNNVTNDDVVVIRGSTNQADWVQNLAIWSQSIMFQSTAGLVLSSTLPVDTVQAFIRATSFMDKAFEATLDVYYDPVEKVIEELLAANRTTSEVMVIGHSLGGGVAKIAGSHTGVKAVGFNAPGIVYAARKLGLTEERIDANVVNVVSRKDFVSKIDLLGGTVQTIQCLTVQGSDLDDLACHDVLNQAAELLQNCNFQDKKVYTALLDE